jgi:hypothetical protein
MTYKLIKTDNYLLVVDDSEIKAGDWIKWSDSIFKASVDTEYLPPTKKIIAHLLLNGSPILEGVDLLPPIEDNVEDLAKDIYPQPNPTEFESEMVGVIEHKDGLVTNQYEIPKTITTAQGVQWVGKYK